MVGIFNPFCELVIPTDEGIILVYCILLPLYLLSGLPPLPSQTKSTVCMYTDSVWGGGGVELCCRPYSCAVSVIDQIQNLQNCFIAPNKNDQ